MSRLLAAIAAAVLLVLGAVAPAHADPNDVTISLPGGIQGEDRTPLVTGTGDPLYPVHVLVNDVEVTQVTPAQDGTWSYQLTTPLAEGEQASISARVLDDFDSSILGEAVAFYYVYPPVQPVVITEPTSGQVINGHFDLRAQATDGGATYRLFLDGKPVPADDASIGFEDDDTLLAFVDIQDFTNGPHQLQLRGTDAWDRPLSSQVVEVVGDVTGPPKPVITSPSPNQVVTSHHVVIAGTAAPGQELTVVGWESGEPTCEQKYVTAEATGAWSCDLRKAIVDYNDGSRFEFHITAWSYDEVGNRTVADMVPFVLDLRTAAAPEPAPSPSRPASAVPASLGSAAPAGAPAAAPELANTGSSTAPGVSLALLLIAVGVGLTSASRRLLPTEG